MDISKFGKNHQTADGLTVYCKPCCDEHTEQFYSIYNIKAN
jgi:hypothetical protein